MAEEIPDYYELLGIDPDASDDDVRAAHRRAASHWHPDRNKAENAIEMMRHVNNARDTLLSASKRWDYNKTSRVHRQWQSGRSRRRRGDSGEQRGQSRPATSVDYYSVLGVSPGATDAQIADAYEQGSALYQPVARSSSQAAAFLRQIEAARRVLLDPFLRYQHDLELGLRRQETPSRSRGQWDEAAPRASAGRSSVDDYADEFIDEESEGAPRANKYAVAIWTIFILIALVIVLNIVQND